MQIQAKLQQITSGQWVDDTPIERRSPSPEPVYGENGLRTNTREQRVKDKLQRERTVGIQGTCHEWFWYAAALQLAKWQPWWHSVLLRPARLVHSFQAIITEMIRKNPNYKPPPDYRPEKKLRRLRIPQDEYPGYNFIGLIIGPR